MFFKYMRADDPLKKLEASLASTEHSNKDRDELFAEAASDIIAIAERFALAGDLWENYFALCLLQDENTIGRVCELSSYPKGSLLAVGVSGLWASHKIIASAREAVDRRAEYAYLKAMSDYRPSTAAAESHLDPEIRTALTSLSNRLKNAADDWDMMNALVESYNTNGSGPFAIYKAFRWQDDSIIPVCDRDPQTLDSLLGYEKQKEELLANTEAFVDGQAANNILLFGDSGTGKSSSVKALLNVDDLVKKGLRIIEIYKDQFKDIPKILSLIRDRRYRFILFMDDLSFEEFEVEYKYLKAVIEGGLERKPDNVVVYATSNRRNLIREVWSDRKVKSDDVHGGDTMQERLSLADRFGVTIWYGPATKEQYMAMVRQYAGEYGIEVDDGELEKRALAWEIAEGSFSGRTARQFIQYLLVNNQCSEGE